MAGDEDDLDAFFDEVEEVEAEVIETEEKNNYEKQTATTSKPKEEDANASERPPAKRQRPNPRPRGVVVAAASSSVQPTSRQSTTTSTDGSDALRKNIGGKPALGPSLGPTMMAQGAPIGPSPTSAQHQLPPLPPGPPPPPPLPSNKKAKPTVRMAAGQVWQDPTLNEWPENDYRIFVGNLGNEITDQQLYQHFSKYPSLAKAKVVRYNDQPEKSKGFGFVSLLDPLECAKAIREMDQSWLSSRPIRVKRSDWKDRDIKEVRKKQRKEKKQQKRFGMM